MRNKGLILTAALLALAFTADAANTEAEAFEKLCATVKNNGNSTSEKQMLETLDQGLKLDKPYSASLALDRYLAGKVKPSQAILRKSIDNAALIGDYSKVVSRCKLYLASAEPGQDSSEVAALMYSMLIHFMDARDEAYRFMTTDGARFRQSIKARKFDSWYLEEAEKRRDFAGMAAKLAQVLQDRNPLEQERYYFWDKLDWIIRETRRPVPSKFKAATDCKKIANLIRDDKIRKAKMSFYSTYLSFKAGTEGKDDAESAKQFAPVLQSAYSYLTTDSTADTLQDILDVFSDGNWNAGWRENQAEQKKQFFATAFDRISDKDRKNMINWDNGRYNQYIASPEQWIAIGTKYSQLFNSMDLANLPLIISAENPNLHNQQAPYLGKTRSRNAAIINSLAASDDFSRCLDHLVLRESWYLDNFHELNEAVEDMWSTFRQYPRAEQNKLPAGYYEKAMAEFCEKHLSTTPAALDTELAQNALVYAWRSTGDKQEDKVRFAQVLQQFDWVPYTEQERQAVFARPFGEFNNWMGQLKKKLEPAKRKIEEAQSSIEKKKQDLASTKERIANLSADDTYFKNYLQKQVDKLQKEIPELTTALQEAESEAKKMEQEFAVITPLENAFKKAMELKAPDLAKAPNPLCRSLAQAVLAKNGKDETAFLQPARTVYTAVKQYEQSKAPLAKAVLHYIAEPWDFNAMKIADFQCEMLADQLTRWNINGENQAIKELIDIIVRRSRHGLGDMLPEDKKRALKLNEVFARAVKTNFGKGNWEELLDMMVRTSYGRKWRAADVNTALFEEIIKGKHLKSTRLMHYIRSGALPSLAKKYPVESYFDDMFVAECKKEKFLDNEYWRQGGRDSKRKIRNLAAEMFAGLDGMRMGYGDKPCRYDRDAFLNWQSRAMEAEDEPKNKAIEKIESIYGKTRFDEVAIGMKSIWDYRDVSVKNNREIYFQKLDECLNRIAQTPALITADIPFADIRNIDTSSITDEELALMIRHFLTVSKTYPSYADPNEGDLIQRTLLARDRKQELFKLIPCFWKSTTARIDNQATYIKFAEQLAKQGEHELAAVYSLSALEYPGLKISKENEDRLSFVRSKSVVSLGGELPVDKSDPRYAIFSAQTDYLNGNTEKAWQSYLTAIKLFPEMINELDPVFVNWIINTHSQGGEFDRAEALAREMLTAIDKDPERFSTETRAQIILTYANIAFYRMEYPRAKALYGKLVAAKEFADTHAQTEAKFKMVEIDRLTEQYDAAIESVERILQDDKSRYVQTEGFYHLAHIKFDMEEPVEASEYLDRVFALKLNHPEGRILEGRINLMLKQYEKAAELRCIGISVDRNVLVPQKPLRMSLVDENLSIVGKSVAIEIRVWTESGDDEVFQLTPFADMKTRFEGEIMTELGPIEKGDHALQVLGNDKIYYDFSEAFKKNHSVTADVKHTLTVASDSTLYASSGKLMTSEELDLLALEQRVRREMQREVGETALSIQRPFNQIKPGNSVNVRVVDPDRNITHKKDTITISASTSSGDTIPSFTLVETETHSGVFEGAIPTESAPATAYAPDSLEGREPNFAISSGNYPAWVALPDNQRPKTFTVDLNSLLDPGRMTITADVTDRKLKDFLVQTSLNGHDYTTAGGWPGTMPSWDGSPTFTVMKKPPVPEYDIDKRGRRKPRRTPRPSVRIQELSEDLNNASLNEKYTHTVTNMNTSWGRYLFGQMEKLGLDKNDNYIVRFSAAFYIPERQVRRFEVQEDNDHMETILAVDGMVGAEIDDRGRRRDETPQEFEGLLTKGVHRVDVYIVARCNAKSYKFQLLYDDANGKMVPCPAEMFDTAKHPEIPEAIGTTPAIVKANGDASEFEVVFGEKTKARMIRLLIRDFETDAPAIKSIGMETVEGSIILPTASDLLTLRENRILEIVPGDKLSVTYTDNKYINESGRIKEEFLSATYANAIVHAVLAHQPDVTHRPDYYPLRRFKIDDVLSALIKDFDMDVSGELDTVEYTVQAGTAEPVTLQALETGQHTGIFIGKFFPVDRAPQRKSDIRVEKDDKITITYLDQENTEPGISWPRQAVVEQSWYQEPRLTLYDVRSEDIDPRHLARYQRYYQDDLPPTKTLMAKHHEGEEPATVMMGGPVIAELVWPTAALSSRSTTTIYMQTSSAREAKKYGLNEPFDTNVFGTVQLSSYPRNHANTEAPQGYDRCVISYDRKMGDALEDGRYVFAANTTMEEPEPTIDMYGEEIWHITELRIRPDDEIFVGFKYTDETGENKWIVQKATLDADAFFQASDRLYNKPITNMHIGETAYFQVIDKKKNTSDERDAIEIKLESSAGHSKTAPLKETFVNSGIFRGMVELAYSGPAVEVPDDPRLMPATYGCTITATYEPGGNRNSISRSFKIHKGADGDVMPFTKRYKDPEMAVKTKLTVAEAYFELAKKHRQMGEKDAAEREIAEGKRLMEEALKQHPETEMRVQADYLLANLMLELAEEIEEEKERQENYRNAVARFADIVSTYKDSPYAAKAQFKKALALEKMGDIDKACDEYVKLSYRWPDNEFVPETIARLGQYFFNQGKTLAEKAEKKETLVDQKIEQAKSREMFKTAAEVFSSLEERFPTHKLAQKTTVLAAQCFMRAEDFENAIKSFRMIIDKTNMDKDLRAESMYWCADAYLKGNKGRDSYLMYKQLTWDYPESKWAKFARGRLAEGDMRKIELYQFGHPEEMRRK